MEKQNGEIAVDRVLSVEEGIEIKQRIAAQRSLKQWRWMGNYGDPTQASAVANVDPPCLAGEVMFTINGNLTPAWMFY
ncbi:hypothetical protein DEJ51_01105 [Streptomyces venezuelae]|uniref:Uncharacterized protein n=1 Tax=Streptomyces venezuelae TaxID=54571 RepID=A0A5P2DD71_STRVZ|nr:hypothetical protein [Streptomyces venezuelae]QES53032.1 hypothetical protein DEJ51_01105 [Streptomyces venezuelae]